MFEHLMKPETLKLRDEVRDFVKSIPSEMLNDMDQEKIRFPKEFLKEAGKRNLFGCRYPVKWGGRGLDWVSTGVVMEEVGVLGYIMACTFGVGAELVCDAIISHGTDYQKEKYVKPLLKGEIFAAECLTEPRGGSDFFGATTIAEDKGDYFVLNGQKRFIVGGEGADFFLVYAKTDVDAKPHKSLSCFIVDRTEGVNVEYIYGLMGCRGGGTARIVFKDVKVPKENIVGQLNNVIPVFNTMMVPERLGTAAMTIGAARPALEIATRYTTRRKAFGKEIANFQGVSFQVAEAAMKLDAARAFIYAAASAIDSGVESGKARRLVSEAKKFVTESCQDVVHNSMQVMGGIGYTNIYPVEKIYRDIRLSTIWTGSNEVMAMIIAHEWYREIMSQMKDKTLRDCEFDCLEAHAKDEKIFE
ncbi:MAG: acyl-CoA dehydrogenase family protein [Desulforegulaceae bacterium]|nr:acyl-CoA dehydrogenase family protein [Desulforegulaceae bacterium]